MYGDLSFQLARIERKLDKLLDHFQLEAADDGLAEVRQLAASGRKIEAIKKYRELTGAGLAEAKAAVEQGL
jgi:ribosomal protein L7/L12